MAKKRKLVSSIVAPGRVTLNSEATAVVGTPIQGRVIDIKVRAGDSVKQGAELLLIESAELGGAQSDYMQKRAAVTAAKSAIEPASSNYDRARKLYEESGVISLTAVQTREIELRKPKRP